MLSFVNLSDPSCSSSKVTADEKDPGQLAPQEADPVLIFDHEAQTPNFSIRDYAFASRSKNISTSWPFSRQFLQLCLKHGIRDLLPPLETPSSVRLHCRRPSVDVSHAGDIVLLNGGHKTTGFTSCLSSEGVGLRCLDETEEDNLREVGKPVKLITNGDCEIGSSLTNHCDIGKNSAQISEPVVKKCRLILKSGAISEPSRAEEIASASSTASDPMASKVCPVCKTFSSTSNTTLNAHMDQCLNFLESDSHCVEDKTSKFKVKLRKKRLMKDIYAAARHCTLEDLDRRNGTCWASDLSLVAASINEVSMVAKEHNLPQVDTRDHKSEGAVYVDSNGIKLRILSKFSDIPQVMSREEFRLRKYDECISSGSQIDLIGKKKHLASKYSKKMKFKLKNRKLSSLKLFKDEVQATAEVTHDEAHIQEQGTQVELSGEQEPISNCGSAILSRWPCSKRSDLPKKVISKHLHKSLELPKRLSGTPISENEKTAPSSAAEKVFFSRSHPESIVAHSTSIDVQSNVNQKKSFEILSSEGTSANAELPRLSAAFGSSLKSASGDLCMVSRHKLDKSPDTNKRSTGSFLLSLKTKRLSNLSETSSITKKLRKHRSLLRTTMRKRDVFSDSNSGTKKSTEASAVRFPGKMVTDQSLLPGSRQHQNANSRSSEMQIETSVLPTIASIKKADDTSILLPETVYAEYRGLPIDTMTLKSMSEPMGQIFHGKLVKQKLDGLECGGVESQAESISAQGYSTCLTSHGDVHKEKCSRASAPLVPNVENKLALSRKPSGSPSSTTSPISPLSPTDCHTTTSDTEHLPSIIQDKVSLPSPSVVVNEGTQEIDVESSHQVPFDSIASQHEQVLDFQPCCCSRQSIKPWCVSTLPNLYISPRTPVMESPTASILTRAGSDFGSPSPTCGTPAQSRTTSSIRLMGKNLIVMNTEEYVDQLPKIHSPTTDNNSNSQSLALPFGFASYAGIPNRQSFSHATVHTTPAPEMSYMAMHRGSFSAQTRKINKACVTNDVILVDDSPGDDIGSRRSLPQAPVLRPMLPSPFPYFARGNNGLRPSYLMDGGISWELTAPLVFQSSPTPHLSPPFSHMHSLR